MLYAWIARSLRDPHKVPTAVVSGVVTGLLSSVICGVLMGLVRGVSAQFPAVCAWNVTRSGVCCPAWAEDGSLVCGGRHRGRCVRIHSEEDVSRVPNDYHHDDRLHWPTRMIQFACECYGNYAGYKCQECREGFKGDNCTVKFTKLRRNLNTLSLAEKQYIVQVMNAARYVHSDYVIQNMTYSSDPSRDPQFLNASVFDYLAYLHYYASRMTNLGGGKCEKATYRLDCAHRGSNFPLWHRYYMILWEREMGKIAGNSTFTFPYWDWVDGGTTCEICTDEFLGATNMSDADKRIRTTNVISTWYVLCYILNDCETCDPGISFALVRHPGNNTEEAARLPTATEVDSFMALDTYDYPDFVVYSRATSFRARIEGYSTVHGPTANLKMHNLVHAFMNGSFSGALTSSFDPVFYFHHSFMDRLFETWLRRTGAMPTQLPSVGSYPGHHRDSYLVPFFPVVKASWYFTSCRNLGYDYDSMYERKTNLSSEGESVDNTTGSSNNRTSNTPTLSDTSTADISEKNFPILPESDTSTSDSSTDREPANPLLRYVIVEAAVIIILAIALISECTFRFRYFVAHHGYTQVNFREGAKPSKFDVAKPLVGDDNDDESDCE